MPPLLVFLCKFPLFFITCEYFQYLLTHIGLAKRIQHHSTLLDAVEKCRMTTRWPDKRNVLDPACWTQGSGTIIGLENKLSPCWRFQVPLKIINRVTLSDGKRKAVPEPGNCNSKCVVSRGLAPCRCEEPCEDPGRHCVVSCVLGFWLAHAPESLVQKKNYLFKEGLHAQAFAAQISKTWLVHHSEA